MGTLLKYLFYIAIIFIAYLIIVGFYDGKLSKNSTISEVSQEVSSNAKRIITNSYEEGKDEVEKLEHGTEDKK